MRSTGRFHRFAQRALQPFVARQAQHVAHVVGFTPRHDRLAAEPGIAANHDPRLRPARTDLADDPFQLLDTARRGILVRRPQPCTQQVLTAEDVQRQIAVAAVIAVEETTLLVTVQRIIGGIQVQPDLARWLAVRFDEQIDQQTVERVRDRPQSSCSDPSVPPPACSTPDD